MAGILDWAGRIGIASYFLWATWFNVLARQHHVAEFARIGVKNGRAALGICLVMQVAGSLLLLWPAYAIWGASILIAFTFAADALFHRYWTYQDAEAQVVHKFFLFEHVALVGGLVAVMAFRLK